MSEAGRIRRIHKKRPEKLRHMDTTGKKSKRMENERTRVCKLQKLQKIGAHDELKPKQTEHSVLTLPPCLKSVHGCAAGCGGVEGATPPHKAILCEVRMRTFQVTDEIDFARTSTTFCTCTAGRTPTTMTYRMLAVVIDIMLDLPTMMLPA